MLGPTDEILNDCLRLLLRPVARFCLRHSFNIQEIIRIFKYVLVNIASEELHKEGKETNVSRVSAMTGIHRKDVKTLLDTGKPTERRSGIVTRVIGQWLGDRDFTDKAGATRTINCQGEDSEFQQLVQKVSNDLNPYTVLAELERMKVVERDGGNLTLREKIHIPKGDYQEGFRILAKDTNDLAIAVENNIFGQDKTPHLHIRTEYDNILQSKIPELKQWILREGSIFHKRVREHISKFDKDLNYSFADEQGGGRISVSAFSLSAITEAKTKQS
jgi:hypothetical protein